jgi:hypothetical protein
MFFLAYFLLQLSRFILGLELLSNGSHLYSLCFEESMSEQLWSAFTYTLLVWPDSSVIILVTCLRTLPWFSQSLSSWFLSCQTFKMEYNEWYQVMVSSISPWKETSLDEASWVVSILLSLSERVKKENQPDKKKH